MRLIAWILKIALFLVLLAFALANTQPVSVHLFAQDVAWEAPMVVVLLAGFAVGALFAFLAVLPGNLRRRRELSRLKRMLDSERAATGSSPRSSGSESLPTIPDHPLT